MAAQLMMFEDPGDGPLQREIRRLSERVAHLERALQEEREKSRRQRETLNRLRLQLRQQPLPF